MSTIAQQSVRGSLANYAGILLGFFIQFFVLTDCLTKSEIGLTRVMVDAALLFSSLAQLGTGSSIVRFFPYFKDPPSRHHGFFLLSLLLPLFGFLLFAVLLLLFREPVAELYSREAPLFADYLCLLLPLTFCALYLAVFEANASVLMHIAVPKAVREVGIRLFNLAAYLLYGHGLVSLPTFMLLFCGSYAAAMLIDLAYLLSLRAVSFRISFKGLPRGLLGEASSFTLFMTAATLAGNIPLFNSLFLGAREGLELAGIYTIASYIANVVEVPYRSLGAIAQPPIAQASKEGRLDEVARLGRQVSLHQFLVASLLFFFIWINLGPLFAVIPHGAEFASGSGVVLFLGMAKIVNSSLSIGTSILSCSRHYMLLLPLILVLTLGAIGFNQVLIPLWGMDGSACATLFSYLIYFALLLGVLWRKLRVSLFCRGHLKVLLLLAVLAGLSRIWDLIFPACGDLALIPLLLRAAAKSAAFVLLAAGLVLGLKVSEPVDRIWRRFFPPKKVEKH